MSSLLGKASTAIVKAAGQAFEDECRGYGKYKNSMWVYWCWSKLKRLTGKLSS